MAGRTLSASRALGAAAALAAGGVAPGADPPLDRYPPLTIAEAFGPGLAGPLAAVRSAWRGLAPEVLVARLVDDTGLDDDDARLAAGGAVLAGWTTVPATRARAEALALWHRAAHAGNVRAAGGACWLDPDRGGRAAVCPRRPGAWRDEEQARTFGRCLGAGGTARRCLADAAAAAGPGISWGMIARVVERDALRFARRLRAEGIRRGDVRAVLDAPFRAGWRLDFAGEWAPLHYAAGIEVPGSTLDASYRPWERTVERSHRAAMSGLAEAMGRHAIVLLGAYRHATGLRDAFLACRPAYTAGWPADPASGLVGGRYARCTLHHGNGNTFEALTARRAREVRRDAAAFALVAAARTREPGRLATAGLVREARVHDLVRPILDPLWRHVLRPADRAAALARADAIEAAAPRTATARAAMGRVPRATR